MILKGFLEIAKKINCICFKETHYLLNVLLMESLQNITISQVRKH